MPIRLKFGILFLSIALVPLFLISALTFRQYKNSLDSMRITQLENIATFKAEKIESYFANLRTNLQLIQNKYIVRKNFPVLMQYSDDPNQADFITAKNALDETLLKDVSILKISSIMLVNPEGKVVYSSDTHNSAAVNFLTLSAPEQKAFLEGERTIYFSDIFFDQSARKPIMLVTAPIQDLDEGFAGVIVLKTNMEAIYSLMQEVTGLGSTGETLLGKKTGNQVLILTPLRHLSAGNINAIKIGGAVAIPLQRAAQGQSGSGRQIDYRGEDVIAAWRNIPSLNWGIVAKIDTQEAFGEIRNLRNLIIVVLVIVAFLCGVIAFAIASSITGSIRRLSQGAQLVGSGNLDYRVVIDSKDEIGQLSRAFDKMTQDLKVSTSMAITERNRLYGVLEALPVYVVLLSEDYRVPFANKFFRERFGESHGKRCYEYLFNRNQVCENCESYKVMQSNAPHHWDWLGPDGRNYDIYDFPFIDADGSLMVLEMGIDITERKKAELALNKLNETLEQRVAERTADLYEIQHDLNRAQAVARTGSWRLAIPQNTLVWSDEAYRIFAVPKGKPMDYETFLTLVHPEDRDYVHQKWIEATQGKPYDLEHRILADGAIKWVREKAELELDPQGKIVGGFGMVSDITERKELENLLRQKSKEQQIILDSVPAMVFYKDKENRFIQVNRVFEEAMGLARNQIEGKSLFDLYPQEQAEAFWKDDLEVINSGKAKRNIIESMQSWQGERLILTDKVPYWDAVGNVIGIIGFAIDVTERKAAEEALRRERANLRTIFDVVNIGMLLINEEGIVKQVNNTISLWLNKDVSVLQNHQPGNIIGCAHAVASPAGCGRTPHCPSCPIRNTYERVLRTGESVHNVEVQTKLVLNNKQISLWFEINVDPLVLDGKRHAILSMNNITTRKQAEEVLMRDKDTFEKLVREKSRELMQVQLELEQAKRLSDIGTLAATVAHELRNPLAAIKMAAFNAQRKAQNPALDKHFSNIEIKLHESENIIDNLLFYSKIKVPHTAPINIHNIFSSCLKDAKERFPEQKITVTRKDEAIRNLLVEADAVQMMEIFSNLLNNAFDAVDHKSGMVEIYAEADTENVKIAVKDNGIGIDKENLVRIFQPFFSTKAKGTGLGLTVAQQIVKLHGGVITIDSERGEGTTVTITLPLKRIADA